MRRGTGALALSVVLLGTIFAPGALAVEKYDTEIVFLGEEPLGNDLYVHGVLTSEKAEVPQGTALCHLWVTEDVPQQWTGVHDSSTTSTHGAWALISKDDAPLTMRVGVYREVLPSGNVCRPASASVDP